ncbi:RTA1 domain protein [Aspergillus sclerotialis]|uniref:RTA1 domain protein n=1 Tax=Aspergillus sclerotialis TaxID=2070753 RepID=A0A3A3A864_9EURO|nr:RTA1 domain protein [Aspergillus sclerotialis]
MLEVAAYGVRVASVKKPDSIPLYAVSSSIVVIAPVFICASLYILIGRLIRSTGDSSDPRDKNSVVRFGKLSSSWIPKLYVASDVTSLLMQASGSAIGGSNDWYGSQADVGVNVLIAGLVLQLATFSLFLLLVIWFDLKTSPRYSGDSEENRVRLVLNGIYVAGFFIMVRLIYRVVEFAMEIGTYTWSHEWLLYVLEATPMFIALVVLGWYHPSRWIKKSLSGRSK